MPSQKVQCSISYDILSWTIYHKGESCLFLTNSRMQEYMDDMKTNLHNILCWDLTYLTINYIVFLFKLRIATNDSFTIWRSFHFLSLFHLSSAGSESCHFATVTSNVNKTGNTTISWLQYNFCAKRGLITCKCSTENY